MSIQLQIAIPVLVAATALVVIAILRKYKQAEAVILPLVLVLFGAFLLTVETASAGTSKQDDPLALEREVALAVVQQYMLDGHYTQASALLDELSAAHADDPDVQKALARCAALQGNFAHSAQLYRGLSDVEEELRLVQQAKDATFATDNALIAKMLSEGRDPEDYGLTKSTNDLQEVSAAVRQTVTEALEQEAPSDTSEGVVEAAVVLNRNYAQWQSTGDHDLDDVADAVETLEQAIDEDETLLQSRTLRLALMRGYVLLERYTDAAAISSNSCQSEELILLLDLYVNELISEEDFPETFMQTNSKQWRTVQKACEEALAAMEGTIPDEVYAQYDQLVAQLGSHAEEPALFAIRTMLMDGAVNGDSAVRSICWLALARLEYYCDNTALMSQYFTAALNTASDSKDPMYRQAAERILSILRGAADSEQIKQLEEFIRQLVQHAMPIHSDETSDSQFCSDFCQQVEQDVSQSTARINIGLITVENKDPVTVAARVQIQSEKYVTLEQIRQNLRVVDCGSTISDFELTPLEYEASRIILLCDISGSMDGSVDSLKNAVIAFADKMEEGEEVCVIGFSDSIEFITEFSGDPETVKSFAEKLDTGGGTALFDSLVECGQYLQRDPVTNNVIIAMTDGRDGRIAKTSEIYEKVGAMVGEKDITVYTLGLGNDVDTEYLQTIAEYGNGDSLYVRSQEQLETFYDFIHGQLRHQYILRYKAKNQTQNQRTLELYMNGEFGEDSKIYYLEDPGFSEEGSDSYVPYTVVDDKLTVTGLSVKFLYKNGNDQYLHLKGSGFDIGDDVTIRLCGNVKYELEFVCVDASTYKLTIPGDIAAGSYDLDVSIRGVNFKFDSELTIAVPGTEKSYSFGDYNFTALNAYDNFGSLVLSGNVTMNGWLHFKGDVVISGDYQGAAWVTMEDNSGAYISYQVSSSHGLAERLAKDGIPLSLGKLGKVKLSSDYYDPDEWKDFTTYDFKSLSALNMNVALATDASMSLYPDMIRLEAPEVKLDLPFQEQLLQGFDLNLETDADLILSATSIDLYGLLEYSSEKSILMVALPLKLKEAKVEIDTMHEEYFIKAIVGLKSIPGMTGLGLSFGVVDGKFDSIGLYTKGDVRLMDVPVPVAIGDLGLEFSNFSQWESDDDLLQKLLKTERTTYFEIEVASLEAYLPEACDVLGLEDVALAALTDCEISSNLAEFRFTFDADVEFFGFLDYGHCKVSIGHYDYTNQLIGFDREDQYGITVATTLGPKFEAGELKLYAQGTQEVTLGYPYTGFWLNGTAGYSVGWWFLRSDNEVSGDALLGVYKNSAGNLQFSAIVRGTGTDGSYSGFHLYITEATGLQINTY